MKNILSVLAGVVIGAACVAAPVEAKKAVAAVKQVYAFLLPPQKGKLTEQMSAGVAKVLHDAGVQPCKTQIAAASFSGNEYEVRCIAFGDLKDMPQGAMFLGAQPGVTK